MVLLNPPVLVRSPTGLIMVQIISLLVKDSLNLLSSSLKNNLNRLFTPYLLGFFKLFQPVT